MNTNSVKLQLQFEELESVESLADRDWSTGAFTGFAVGLGITAVVAGGVLWFAT